MASWPDSSLALLVHNIERHLNPTTGDVSLDYLVMSVSARSLHLQFTIFPLVMDYFVGDILRCIHILVFIQAPLISPTFKKICHHSDDYQVMFLFFHYSFYICWHSTVKASFFSPIYSCVYVLVETNRFLFHSVGYSPLTAIIYFDTQIVSDLSIGSTLWLPCPFFFLFNVSSIHWAFPYFWHKVFQAHLAFSSPSSGIIFILYSRSPSF